MLKFKSYHAYIMLLLIYKIDINISNAYIIITATSTKQIHGMLNLFVNMIPNQFSCLNSVRYGAINILQISITLPIPDSFN